MPSRRASATIHTTTASPNKKMSTVIDTLAGVTSVSRPNCTVPLRRGVSQAWLYLCSAARSIAS